jgi:hypothetical protein
MGYLVFVDVDEQGNIVDAFIGVNIIPSRQYDYFFFTMDEGVMENIGAYKVNIETRELVLR